MAGSAALEPVLEARLVRDARRKLEAPTIGTFQMHAFPVALRLLRGRIPLISIEAAGAFSHGVIRIARLRIDWRGVRISPRAWLGGSRRILVQDARWVAEVTEEGLNEYLARRNVGATLVLLDRGALARVEREIGGRLRRIDAAGRLLVRDGTLAFLPTSVTVDGKLPRPALARRALRAVSFAVGLPGLPGGVDVDEVEFRRGSAVLRARERRWRHEL